jgi:hypothetical protein
VLCPAVHVKNHGACTIEDLLILRPAVQDDLRFQPRHIAQAFGKELHARVELVHPRRMGRPAGDDDEFFRCGILGLRVTAGSQRESQGPEEQSSVHG